MKNSFHNTINHTGQQLEIAEQHCYTQQQRILQMFTAQPGGLFTPFQVQIRCSMEHVPITSIRRAMSNLTKAGHIRKTDVKKTERYQTPNYCWTLA